MAATAKLACNIVGGLVQGNFGVYQAVSGGTITVDTRDVPSLLALGMTYVTTPAEVYSPAKAPAAASAAAMVASVALSNGALTIAASPDVPRPVAVVLGNGTAPITAGTVTLGYTANDGSLTTDVFSAALLASAGATLFTSKGVVKISTGFVSGLVGGTSPFIFAGTTAALTVPVAQGATGVSFFSETVDGAAETIGTSTTTLGGITPTTAPNGTHTYSFGYNYTAPSS